MVFVGDRLFDDVFGARAADAKLGVSFSGAGVPTFRVADPLRDEVLKGYRQQLAA